MNRPAIVIAAALAVALIPVTASAATPHQANLNSDVVYATPRFFVEHKAVPQLPQIVFAFNVTEVNRPTDYHATIEMFRWPPIGAEAHVYGRWLRNIRNLPGIGGGVIWRFPKDCKKGRYYAEVTTTGISSGGKYQRDEVFYPAGRRKVKASNLRGWKWVPDDRRAPDRTHSHRVREC